MPKPSSLASSKLAQLKTKFLAGVKNQGPLSLAIAGVAIIALVITPILIITYRHAPTISDKNPNPDNTQGTVIATPSGTSNTPNTSSNISTAPSNTPSDIPKFVNLQPTVDAWLKTTSMSVGLMIYDLDNDRIAASYQPNRVFDVASIYKLFFVYDGYRQIETGTIKSNTKYVTTTDYRADTYTYGECLDLMIRESYNGCADKMRSDKKASARVTDLIDELGLKNTTNAGLSSTAADLTKLLQLYYQHSDLSDVNWQKIADSMLNQPTTKVDTDTIYNWRQGLPSGFSSRANIYDKVGWAWDEDEKTWDTYADAAIVEFPEQNRHYTVVVLTSGLTSRTATPIANLGTRIENAILNIDSAL